YYHRGEEQRESVAVALKKATSEVTRRDADQLLKRRLQESGRAGWVSPSDEARVTVEDLLEGLETDYRLNGRPSINILAFRLAPIRSTFGADRARDVTEDRIERFKEELIASGRKPATVNRVLAALKRAFKIAIRQKRISMAPTIPLLVEDN